VAFAISSTVYGIGHFLPRAGASSEGEKKRTPPLRPGNPSTTHLREMHTCERSLGEGDTRHPMIPRPGIRGKVSPFHPGGGGRGAGAGLTMLDFRMVPSMKTPPQGAGREGTARGNCTHPPNTPESSRRGPRIRDVGSVGFFKREK